MTHTDSTDVASRREAARRSSGEFGLQTHSAPEVSLESKGLDQPEDSPRMALHRRRIEAIAEWVAVHGRFPVYRRETNTPEVDSLGAYLRKRKQQLRDGVLDPNIRTMMDDLLPGWDGAYVRKEWEDSLERLATWTKEHSRLPTVTRHDPEEARAGMFLGKQRRKAAAGLLPATQVALLDAAVPNWDSSGTGKHRHRLAMARELAGWVEKHGRLPRSQSRTDAGTERKLRSFLDGALEQNRMGILPDDLRRTLDSFVPEWSTPLMAVWHDTLSETKAWITQNKRRPTRGRRGATVEEERLALFISNQRRFLKAGKLTPERVSLLDQNIPGWRER